MFMYVLQLSLMNPRNEFQNELKNLRSSKVCRSIIEKLMPLENYKKKKKKINAIVSDNVQFRSVNS